MMLYCCLILIAKLSAQFERKHEHFMKQGFLKLFSQTHISLVKFLHDSGYYVKHIYIHIYNIIDNKPEIYLKILLHIEFYHLLRLR